MNVSPLFALFALLDGAILFAAPPPNNDFANAGAIGGPVGHVAGTNVGATTESGEPSLGAGHGDTIWYRWTAPYSGDVNFGLIDADPDFTIAAYQGESLAALTQVAAENTGSSPDGFANFAATAGTTYHLAIGSFGGLTGPVELRWTYSAPPNDDFAAALEVSGTTIAPTVINVAATTQVGEPASLDGIPVARTAWYSWTAPFEGILMLSTQGSDFDTTLFYTSNPALADGFEDGNDEDPGVTDGHSNLELAVHEGEVFHIAVGGKPAPGGIPPAGRIQLTLDFRPADEVSFTTESVTVPESVGEVTLEVTRSGPNGVEIEYDVFIVAPDGTSTMLKRGLAEEETTDAVTVPIADNSTYDGPRDYEVFLSFDEPGDKPGAITHVTIHVLDDDPFVPVARSYSGFFTDPAERIGHTGPVQLTLTPGGAFSIKTALAGVPFRAIGRIAADGNGTAVFRRLDASPLRVTFQIPAADARLAGTIGDETFSAPLTAVRLLEEEELAGSAVRPGFYTGFLADPTRLTGGDGRLFGELKPDGRWIFRGRSIDGQPFVTRSAQGAGHDVAFFGKPYGPGNGVIAGILARDQIDSTFAGSLLAVKAPTPGTPLPLGFDLSVTTRLAPFAEPAVGELPGTGFNENGGAATLRIYRDGNLEVTQGLHLVSNGTATLVSPENLSGFTLRANFINGRAAGSFRLPGMTASVAWNGSIYTGPGLTDGESAITGLGTMEDQTFAVEISPH